MTARRPAPSRPVSVVLLVTAAALLFVALPNMGTAIRAAQADGAPGTFTATRLDCVQHPGHESCIWSGTFRPRGDGRSRVVAFYGSGRDSMRAGEVRPAVDIGVSSRVYDPRGSREWMFTAALLVAGYAVLAYLAHVHLMPPPGRTRHRTSGAGRRTGRITPAGRSRRSTCPR